MTQATTQLSSKHCAPCEGGCEPLKADRIDQLLPQVPGWKVIDDGMAIQRRFEFKGFFRTMSFINAMAWIANQEGHHPDFSAGFNFCEVTFTTHDIDGLSENDFICAARVNALLDEDIE
ncbi:MAG: 4a-hydroxytetrahydrobiopterin dehydratase [Xanthomonadales bacterium]|jgi:4a-hydroxytetrahydrobiopterin dehydratase|nr:4a-hydroxytetrahydrobiopterin dehydratase [Xanthomonadales bacterium]